MNGDFFTTLALDQETLDGACYRIFGNSNALDWVILNNPNHLTTPFLKAGAVIKLPNQQQVKPNQVRVKLWS